MVSHADVPALLTLLSVAVGAVAYQLYLLNCTRRLEMARRSSQFRREATKIPYDMELDNGETVVFEDPNRLTSKSAFELSREQDPEKVLRLLLGKSFNNFWSEFGDRPVEETNAVIEDVMSYYGADKSNNPAAR